MCSLIIWNVQLVWQRKWEYLVIQHLHLKGMAVHKSFKNWKAGKNKHIFNISKNGYFEPVIIFMGVSFVNFEHRESAVSCIFLKISLQFWGEKSENYYLKKQISVFTLFNIDTIFPIPNLNEVVLGSMKWRVLY